MPLQIQEAVEDVLLGASLSQVAATCRARLIEEFDFRPDEVAPDTFVKEVGAFMRRFARHLGDRHQGEPRICQALLQWVQRCDHYEAWDALLSGFRFEARERLVRKGRLMFPGPLTSHWTES